MLFLNLVLSLGLRAKEEDDGLELFFDRLIYTPFLKQSYLKVIGLFSANEVILVRRLLKNNCKKFTKLRIKSFRMVN